MNANVNWRRMISQRLNINSTIQGSRLVTHAYPYFEDRTNVSADAGITGNNQDPAYWGPPNLNFNSINTPAMVCHLYTANHYRCLTVVQWTHRPHEFQFGADIRRQEFNALSQQNPRGLYNFTGAASQQQQERSRCRGSPEPAAISPTFCWEPPILHRWLSAMRISISGPTSTTRTLTIIGESLRVLLSPAECAGSITRRLPNYMVDW